jgi:PPOX class probable F420-dependent enzyme
MSETDFSDLIGEKFISLTTYYKNGRGVATPVDFFMVNDILYVDTKKDSYKVKRIKKTPIAKIAPCTEYGKLKGPEREVSVRIVIGEEIEVAKEAFRERDSSLGHRILAKLFFWRLRGERVYLAIERHLG